MKTYRVLGVVAGLFAILDLWGLKEFLLSSSESKANFAANAPIPISFGVFVGISGLVLGSIAIIYFLTKKKNFYANLSLILFLVFLFINILGLISGAGWSHNDSTFILITIASSVGSLVCGVIGFWKSTQTSLN